MAYLLETTFTGESTVAKLKRVILPNSLPDVDLPVYVLDERGPLLDAIDLYEDEPGLSDVEIEKSTAEKNAKDRNMSRVQLPPECIYEILKRTQEGAPYDLPSRRVILENASLVCKLWTDPARRVLFGQTLTIPNVPSAIQRLREVFKRYPELGRVVHKCDFSVSWRRKTIGQVFKRAAGLLRSTPAVQDLSFVHYELSDKVQDRFFAALRTIRPQKAEVKNNSTPMGPSRRAGGTVGPQISAKMAALGRLLSEWTSLEVLHLNDYSYDAHLLRSSIFDTFGIPTYHLTHLSLSDVVLPELSLLHLIGSNPSSLMDLKLETVRKIPNSTFAEVFRQCTSLKHLVIVLDTDFDSSETYQPEILSTLINLVDFTLYTDVSFPEDTLETVVNLPNISNFQITLPSISYQAANSAILGMRPFSLKTLTIETQDIPDTRWTEEQCWNFMRGCNEKDLALMLNGLDADDIEDDWWGIDLREDWKILEKLARPRKSPRPAASNARKATRSSIGGV